MKPFAILMLSDLTVRYFDHKDDWMTAIETMTRNNNQNRFIALKYHHGAQCYTVPELMTTKS